MDGGTAVGADVLPGAAEFSAASGTATGADGAAVAPVGFEAKLCMRAELAARVAALPHPVVLTNGVFDILHRGHATYLARARALGASLVVAVNADASVRRLGKGADRPINVCADRMALLAALESVSLVVEFDEDTAREVALDARPDLYVKGGDYVVAETPEGRAVIGYGGGVAAIAFEFERSTTAMLSRIRGYAPSGVLLDGAAGEGVAPGP